MAAAYFFQRNFALELGHGVVARVPTHPVSLRFMAASLVHLGKLDELVLHQQLLQANPDFAISKVRLCRTSGAPPRSLW